MGIEASDVLRAARGFIERRDSWCQAVIFDDEGRRCAIGALADACRDFGFDHAYDRSSVLLILAADALLESGRYPVVVLPEYSIPYVNDILGHGAVMEMYDLAISMALSEEAANGS